MKGRLVAQLAECVRKKLLPATVQPQVAFRVLTMGLVGVAVMRLSDRMGPTEDADQLAEDVLSVTLAGLGAGVVLKSMGIPECPQDEQVADLSAS
jgi:hypothetical protein